MSLTARFPFPRRMVEARRKVEECCARLVLVLVCLTGAVPAAAGFVAASFAAASFAPLALSAQQPAPAAKPETHITQEQAQQLFHSVDDLIRFASLETGLPVKSQVKRTLTTRAAVEKYLTDKFNDDQDAKRMQRGEIVLKKFGMLDRDFQLKPFLLALLKEQIAGYYDAKTKTVYMLDWIDPESQKPVLVHELTHALQDQHVDLDKWSNQTPPDVSHNVTEDNDHLAKDEMDTARTAVLEGQAMAVFVDYSLKPTGRSLIKDPELVERLEEQMSSTADSPVLARAPLLLSESLLFPYKEGLSFEQDVWMDKGREAAFTGTLDRPPSSSWEVMNPRMYEQKMQAPIPAMPDIHPLVDARYRPYDIGQIGQLDLRILAELYGGPAAARRLTSAWDGGIYWAGQLKSAHSAAEQASTASIALLYLSAWKNPASARVFAAMYANELGEKYSGVKAVAGTGGSAGDDQVYSTSEGPVLIRVRDRYVFVAESFDVETARKLGDLMIDAQGTGELQTASSVASHREQVEDLSSSWIRFLGSCGVMKAALGR